MSRIVQVANFVTPTSGGLRTTLGHLAQGYAERGHDVIQVVPGKRDSEEAMSWGRLVTVAAPPMPGSGYRIVTRPRRVAALLRGLRPDRLEVHDRSTLRGLGRWAGLVGVPSMVISHERLDRLLKQWLPGWLPTTGFADRSNAALASSYNTVLCTTDWAAAEFERIGTTNLVRVPLGVDLDLFHPDLASPQLRGALAPDGAALLVMASRLSREKRPELAIAAFGELLRRGRQARLVVAGDGPLRADLQRQAAGLPVEFVGFVSSQPSLAALLATADVLLAPGPVETFGLAALEALASGTPIVANSQSALSEVLGSEAGLTACHGIRRCITDAVEEILDRPVGQRRRAARTRAEGYPWSATVSGFLSAHRLAEVRTPA